MIDTDGKWGVSIAYGIGEVIGTLVSAVGSVVSSPVVMVVGAIAITGYAIYEIYETYNYCSGKSEAKSSSTNSKGSSLKRRFNNKKASQGRRKKYTKHGYKEDNVIKGKTKQVTNKRNKISKKDINKLKEKFLGKDYIKVDDAKWRNLDESRQFRCKYNDLNGKHGNIGSHVHLEFLDENANVLKNIHIPVE